MMPQRIQRKRTKGWKMPEGAVYVGRPTMWGNYAPKADRENRAYTVEWFRRWVCEEASEAWKGRAKIELGGKDLACWCRADQPCHADVLLELANR
jgi:hypothetical protein